MSETNLHDKNMMSLESYCQEIACCAKDAAYEMASVSGETKNAWLRKIAESIKSQSDYILTENQKDINTATNLSPPEIDRLTLNPQRLDELIISIKEIEMFPNPIGEIIESTIRPNGLEIQKVRAPLGVIFFIYESRPNVTTDAAAICVKSGNAVILRGGKEAINSNIAFAKILSDSAAQIGLPDNAVQLVENTEHNAVGEFLKMSDYISVTIPRGGENLIRRVAAEAKMPVIKHFAGNCHVYIDNAADPELAISITINSKCQRLGVCNAAESLVVHAEIANTIMPKILNELEKQGVEIRGCEKTRNIFPNTKTANESDYKKEYHDAIISVKIVNSIDEAIKHINLYSDKHTETIITTNLNAARKFAAKIDSSAVIINASTRFNDGYQIGLGAEIGISTDKLHARGPCGIKELTTYKYVIYGNGQIRN
ncbi:MAG: glutamate-5-semialdehyde dehydrogenase [Planctomycetaceae bacterium]|jgi:glutamate-5-semialdehyde dehydrogenase|nr:glutamate-5-semialdehyde dehydrogenase [Planctomycetaceae bacterium]